jgi:site-specific DNA-methyltransferase (adenine-specific)
LALLLGDCLNELKKIDDSSVDLIYLDPPFFTQKRQTLKTRDNSMEYSFDDNWDSIDDYMGFMRKRLMECKRVLKDTGSIFLHCDKSASHYLRVVLDEVFGMKQFQSEIIWCYRRWSNAKKGLLGAHQTIYFYSKTPRFKFNKMYTDYAPSTNIDQILQKRIRNHNGKSVYKTDQDGEIVFGDAKKGVPLSDVWQIPYLNPKAKERTGYPTQKPILLLERIIELVTDEADLVLDPFCGSGTTLVAAKLLNRNYIGIDINEEAIGLTQSRLDNPVRTNSQLLEKGEEAYQNKTDEELALLKTINAQPVQRNSGIDGIASGPAEGSLVAIKIQKEDESLREAKRKLVKASKGKAFSLLVLIRTHLDKSLALFDKETINEEVLVIDSYDLLIENHFAGLCKS